MNDLKTLVEADRRLAILRVLRESNGYSASDALLRMMLEQLGHRAGMDAVQADLAWLRDAGLLSLSVVGGVYLAALTARGEDVALGRTQVPGVAHLIPGRF